jgi:hypothetical protein
LETGGAFGGRRAHSLRAGIEPRVSRANCGQHFFLAHACGLHHRFSFGSSAARVSAGGGTGLVLVGLQLAVLRAPLKALPAFALLGLSSLLLLAVRRIWSSGQERQLLYDSLVPPLLFLLLGYFGSGPLALVGRLHPKTLDLFLYSFDQSLGVQLSFKVGQVVLASHLLTRVTLGVYYMLPLVIMFTYARLLVRDRSLAMMAFWRL